MVPQDFHTFLSAAASASGALIGLLFVAVSIAPERTIAPDAPLESRATAVSALYAFSNSFFIALYGLVPGANIGTVTIAVAALGLTSSLGLALVLRRADVRVRVGRRGPSILVAVGIVYALELADGVDIRGAAHDTGQLQALAGLLLALYAAGLVRSWQLLGARKIRVRRGDPAEPAVAERTGATGEGPAAAV